MDVQKFRQDLNVRLFVAIQCFQRKEEEENVTADSSELLIMELCTKEQHVFNVGQYFKDNEDLAATIRIFCIKYAGNHELTCETELINDHDSVVESPGNQFGTVVKN